MWDDNIINAINFEPICLAPNDAWIRHIPFASFVIGTIKPGLVVELGVHTGNSFCAFSQSVLENDLPCTCYGIDTFQGDKHAGLYDESVFNDLSGFIRNNFSKTSFLIRATFDESVNNFSDDSIDLLHIDGLHTYEAVKHDFETWLPKLKKNGVILIHDITVRHLDFGVWKLWEEIKNKFELTFEFSYGYGLGIVCLNENHLSARINNIGWERLEKLFFAASQKIQYKFNYLQAINDGRKAREDLIHILNTRTWRWGNRIAKFIRIFIPDKLL